MNRGDNLLSREKLMKYAMWLFVGLAGMTAYFSFIFGQQINENFYFGFVLLIVIVPGILFFRSKMLKYGALNEIKDNWGKPVKRKRNFKDIRKLQEYLQKENQGRFTIDNQTWTDLDMDKVFDEIDSTLSSPGEQVLYSMLRNPEFQSEALNKRNDIIKMFQSDAVLREKIQTELYWLSRQQTNTIAEFFWGELPKRSIKSVLFSIMGLTPLVLLLLMPLIGLKNAGFLILIVFFVNMYIHYKFRKQINMHLDSMAYLSSLVNTAKSIQAIQQEALREYAECFKNAAKHVKASRTAGILGSIEGVDAVADYFNILFLIKERKFHSVLSEMSKNREILRELYLKLGELDALISIASYRKRLKFYTEPDLSTESKHIKVLNMAHPLIEEPVPNSITIDDSGIVLTGSNMSGKSTFLRTVGINVLFAQTIFTCLAESYRGSYFKILSSISPSDDVVSGKSYYLGEAEAVLRIIKSCGDGVPTLCIIDEIFRGTNPVERISASAEILDFLINHNSLPIVATHDLELTEIVDDKYECYYFTEDVGEEGLVFDYKIRKGVSPTRNAIKLLKYLGYPDTIIDATNKRVDIMFAK